MKQDDKGMMNVVTWMVMKTVMDSLHGKES